MERKRKRTIILLVTIHLVTLTGYIILPNTTTLILAAISDVASVALLLYWWPFQQKDRGVITRHKSSEGHINLWLKTHHGETLRAQIATEYFQRLKLKRNDYVIINRSVNRSSDGQQYIQILNLRKVDPKSN